MEQAQPSRKRSIDPTSLIGVHSECVSDQTGASAQSATNAVEEFYPHAQEVGLTLKPS